MSAAARLTRVSASGHPTLRRQARFHLFRIDGDWEGMRRWIEAEVPEPNLGRDPVLLAHHLRALGETGDLNGLLAAFQRHGASLRLAAQRRSVSRVVGLAWIPTRLIPMVTIHTIPVNSAADGATAPKTPPCMVIILMAAS